MASRPGRGSTSRLPGLVVAAIVAGCSFLPPPAGIQVILPENPDAHVGPHPVTIVDHAGIVKDAAAAPRGVQDGVDASVEFVVLGDHVLVTWTGGECDDRTILTIDRDGDRYRVHIDMQSSATSCSAVGIIRTVRFTLNRAVGADAFEPG